ncbi:MULTISPECIES: RagB/SusD family nutrient uptake outer membrane protein [unclassified Sphingobacterium]|uniref:RagB/SusD family nutrient uptake outer membrane protein n=1 Tax=unclassified Sphingobacterium TaxID=2609468 RepID=UPI00104814D8|nr:MULTISPECIES: RagB/SusD family nutrient uptake outer membrane protein [unclassified Sphingobacterium]MCS3554196.1 hypothetical protein [Sphingobacterium sp. JUb21]TCR08029.1 putative outer membrane starch-binding protein [Sphingobacterium sp. JUb20]
MKKNIFTTLFIALVVLQSCSKGYLDVSDELSGGMKNIEEVFKRPSYAKRFYANVFTGIPDYSSMIRSGQTGLHNPWAGMTDEISNIVGDNRVYMLSARNANNMSFHRWGTLYSLIRQANIFLERAKVIEPSGTDAEMLTQEELSTLKANVRFMRAYYHFLLFEQYGPIIIMNKSYEPTEEQDLPRNSLDEVIKYIDDEILASIEGMEPRPFADENYRAVPTKGAALAVRAKLWLYAASPLFNGGNTEYANLSNLDGKKLFPVADQNKWNKAAEATKDLITYAEQGNHTLYKVLENGVINANLSVYELFQKYNDEIIWATPNTGWGGMDGDMFERRSTPRSEPNGLGNTALLQELVDDFYMNDGLPINKTDFLSESPKYSEAGYGTLDGQKVSKMYLDREPRFYNTVFFEGRKWHVSNRRIDFHFGSANDRSNNQHTASGYMLYKRFNKRVHKTAPGVTSIFRPSIIFRLGEFYLRYAEALNEVDPQHPDILKYLNLIRQRAGIPNIEQLNPTIIGNKDLQRKSIRRECRVELATEGQRYFDVRRWMIAETTEGKQGGPFYGMNMQGDETNFHKRTVIETRIFEPKLYLYPIPFTEMQKSNVLVQNIGW